MNNTENPFLGLWRSNRRSRTALDYEELVFFDDGEALLIFFHNAGEGFRCLGYELLEYSYADQLELRSKKGFSYEPGETEPKPLEAAELMGNYRGPFTIQEDAYEQKIPYPENASIFITELRLPGFLTYDPEVEKEFGLVDDRYFAKREKSYFLPDLGL